MMADRLFEVEADELDDDGYRGDRPTTSTIGGLVELEAAIKLARRGHKIAAPIIDDDGVDLIVDYRWRVQVKSAGPPRETRDAFSYAFHLVRGRYTVDGTLHIRRRIFNADFFICCARPVDAWWVVPRDWLLEAGFNPSRHTAFSLSTMPQNQTKYATLSAKCRDAWHLFDHDVAPPLNA